MASISKLINPSLGVAAPPSSSSLRSDPKLSSLALRPSIRGLASPLRLSIRRDRLNTTSLAVRCSGKEGNGVPAKRTTLHDLYEQQGQSPWYDNLCRPVTDLLPLIASGVRGVTSNPTIFQKAISSSSAYDEQFKQLVSAGKDIETIYWELVIKDIQDACKLFEPIYDQTDGGDGYVSVEVSPRLANDTKGTVEAAKWLHKMVNRPNVYIKIPATAECIPSIREVISNGISVNVTLIFSLSRYEAVIDAYLEGLESSGLSDLSRVTSVASFFVSRVDTLAAVAQAALAYKLYQKKFSESRIPGPLYVDPLIGPDTVSTMPDQALQAFIDHGTVSRTIDSNISEAEGIYSALEKLGIDWNQVGVQLEAEGVDSFKKSFDSLLVSLKQKSESLKPANL
uniref:Uncharacterized protein n=1 Tax=Ananas comosus var. bracteatus TaxID=296719 RepID=A0A6V7QV68_ANACO